MLISQKTAIKQLHAETGRSIEFCTSQIKALPKTPDGKREKVHIDSVRMLVRVLNKRPILEVTDAGIKPLSEKHRRELRAAEVTRQAVAKVLTR